MIGKMLKCCAAAVAVFSLCATISAADLVDNPRYQEWSKYKPGTLIKMDMTTAMGEQKIKSAITTTLKEVTPEKVVIEMKTSMGMPGMAPQENVISRIEPAKIEKTKIRPVTPEEIPNCKVISKGAEDLKIGDKTYKCNWYEVEMEQQGMKLKSKMWTCDDVVDKLVKNEIKMDMGNTTMVLVEFKAIK
ncbi:MAG TPA: hypothetical protein DET40_09750 [Lentisphaeria bacterium]|nr:MAG: hypothetical protein A2X45_08535 [Lentisphaerae bacterium GWF2_50_93]HCE43818.1 hypothetical protein [Lentisphaeria bacterium]